jgi:hypothetical protein
MIVDDIRQGQRSGDKQHVLALLHVLHHFLKTHRAISTSPEQTTLMVALALSRILNHVAGLQSDVTAQESGPGGPLTRHEPQIKDRLHVE